MKVKGKHVVLSFVTVVIGFLVTFSYQFTSNHADEIHDRQWQNENEFRQDLLQLKKVTKELQQELTEKQQRAREFEAQLAEQERTFKDIVSDVEKLRMFAGTVKVKGPGIEVTLADASYVKSEENANNYIVHESHIHKVINELKVSGSNAIAINGQRLLHDSYIACIGPVISVDGNEYSAPFVITAIGNPDDLFNSLTIHQGIRDQLVMDNIEVKIEKKQDIILDPYLGSSEDQI